MSYLAFAAYFLLLRLLVSIHFLFLLTYASADAG